MNETINISINLGQLISWILIGLIAGLLARALFRERGLGWLGSVVVGLLGAVLGSLLFRALGVDLPPVFDSAIQITLGDVTIAFIGALVVLLIANLVSRAR